MKWTIDEIFAANDKVVARWTARGTNTGSLMGIPPTGKTFVIPGVVIDTLKDGKVVERHEMWDQMSFMQQIGLVPG